MPTAFQVKEQAVTDTPLLLFDCQFQGGQAEHWSTHQVTLGGITYQARILQHNLYEIQTSSDLGVDAIPKISISLANADSRFSEIERSAGFKGAAITARFVFFDHHTRRCHHIADHTIQGHSQPAGRNYRIDVSRHSDEPHEHAAGTAAAGAGSTTMSLGVSIQPPATAGSSNWRRQGTVFQVLPLWLLTRRGGRRGQPQRLDAVHLVRVHKNGLSGEGNVQP